MNNTIKDHIKMNSSKSGIGRRFLRDERGLSSVEYVVLLVIVVVGGIGLWTNVGGKVTAGITNADTKLGEMNDNAP